MFDERIEHLRELFEYRLGVALTMERDALTMLHELEVAARNAELRRLFSHRLDETEWQLRALERAFELLGREPRCSPSAATTGLMRECLSMLARTEEPLRDGVELSAALTAAHYETAVYEGLVVLADAVGEAEVRALLERSLEQERQASEQLSRTARGLVRVAA